MTIEPPDWAFGPNDEVHGEIPRGELVRPFSTAQLLEIGARWLEGFIKEVLKALAGAFIPGGGSAFDQLVDWAENIPGVSLLTGLFDFLGGIDLEDPDLNPIEAGAQFFRRLLSFGVPTAAITDQDPNMLRDRTFAAGSIANQYGDSAFTLDMTTSRTDDGSGSAKIVLDGDMHAIRSGSTQSDVMFVQAGQQITETIWVRHTSAVGAVVVLQVVPFIGTTAQDPVTLATFRPSGTVAWPGTPITGDWTVSDLVTGIQKRVLVFGDSGTIWLDDAVSGPVGLGALETPFGETLARWQLLVDTIFNANAGANQIGAALEDLFESLLNINPGNVGGVNGPDNIGDSVRAMLDSIIGGVVGQEGTGASLADAFNLFKGLGSDGFKGRSAFDLLADRGNSPTAEGPLPGSEANYEIASANTSLTVTPTVSLITTFAVKRSAPLGVVEWLGCGTAGVTGFYLNIRKLNALGTRTLVFHSDNLVGELIAGSSPGWESCVLDEPIARVQGEKYEYEFVTVGGNHTIKGMSFTDNIPDHPTAKSVALGIEGRDHSSDPDNPSATVSFASVHSSPNVPWVSTSIDSGEGDVSQRDPSTQYLGSTPTTIPIPNYVAKLHPVGVGASGGGSSGLGFGTHGKPGKPGKWNATVWEKGVHFNEGDFISFEPAANNSASTVFTIVGTEHTLTAESGADGTGTGIDGNWAGPGPVPFTFGDEPYVGGKEQKSAGRDGNAPGGAGAGGSRIAGLFEGGGEGAPGGGWLRFIPGTVSVPDPDPSDTTPPTPPTSISLVSSTTSSLTVSISGGTD